MIKMKHIRGMLMITRNEKVMDKIVSAIDEFNSFGYDPTGPEAGARFREYDDLGELTSPEDEMGIFEDYTGPDNPNYVDHEMDIVDRAFEGEGK